VGQRGEMTQALYAHMKNETIKKRTPPKKESLHEKYNYSYHLYICI
jgi:hypothetical protein